MAHESQKKELKEIENINTNPMLPGEMEYIGDVAARKKLGKIIGTDLDQCVSSMSRINNTVPGLSNRQLRQLCEKLRKISGE